MNVCIYTYLYVTDWLTVDRTHILLSSSSLSSSNVAKSSSISCKDASRSAFPSSLQNTSCIWLDYHHHHLFHLIHLFHLFHRSMHYVSVSRVKFFSSSILSNPFSSSLISLRWSDKIIPSHANSLGTEALSVLFALCFRAVGARCCLASHSCNLFQFTFLMHHVLGCLSSIFFIPYEATSKWILIRQIKEQLFCSCLSVESTQDGEIRVWTLRGSQKRTHSWLLGGS